MTPEWRIETTRTGMPTTRLNGKMLHSRFDPLREAEKAADQVPDNAAIVILAGLGLGYIAEALHRRRPDRLLVIAEADADMPVRASAVRDLRGLLSDPMVRLIAGGDPGSVREFLTGGPTGSIIHLVEWKPSTAAHPDWYRQLAEIVEETSRRRAVNARTLERFGRLWVRNLAANIPVLTRAVSLEQWSGRFADFPAMVLAGGPSLERILEQLKDLHRRYLIIAVDTALPAVLRAGVKPDVIAAVDPQYWNSRHLDRCGEGAGDAMILAESATHPAVFRRLYGRPWLTRTRFPLGTRLEDAAGIRGELKAGGSVATAAWELARHLGCSPMIIAGLDLGFPGRRTHYAGSLSRERPHLFAIRTAPAENAFYHALHDASPYVTENAAGTPILTDLRMDIYAAWFAESVAGIGNRTPAAVGCEGRRIAGLDTTTVETLLERPIRRDEIDRALAEVRSSPADPKIESRILEVLNQINPALKELQRLAEKGLISAERATEALADGENPARYISEMENLDRKLLDGSGRDIVSFLIQPIILEITSSQESENGDALNVSARLYRGISESAAYHLKYLAKSWG
ncbi:MAG: DUF115 domain-containing protein [Spirochaetaceae bacterium]|nr:DUF115 domain-containing protein [Spirochaetaceae bacterium]